MSRRISRTLALLAIALAITGALLAAATFLAPHTVLLHAGHDKAYFLGWDSGWLRAWTQEVLLKPSAGDDVEIQVSTPRLVGFYVTQPNGHPRAGGTSQFEPALYLPSTFGLRWGETRLLNGTIGGLATNYSFYTRARTVQVFAAHVAVAASLPMLFMLARRFARRRWPREGRCVNCGYDLRATPDRCPECGVVPRPSLETAA